jgi:anti-sigma factor ChrR (cupin superfamily)
MSSIDLEELAALDAVGALTENEQRTLRERLSSASPAERQAVAQMYDLAQALVTSSVEGSAGAACEPPRPQVRAQLLARVSSPRSFSVLTSDGEWADTAIPGLTMKVLSHDRERDSAVLLMRAKGGVRYPAHHHGGAEECYVISGEVRVQGRTLHAGDFHHAEPGSDHDELYTETGAEILLVVAASDYGLM